jgi:hypothetical protein
MRYLGFPTVYLHLLSPPRRSELRELARKRRLTTRETYVFCVRGFTLFGLRIEFAYRLYWVPRR